MKRTEQWMAVVAIVGSLALAACQKKAAHHEAEHPATVEKIEGSDLKRVTLTAKAIERLDLKTDEVREQRLSSSAPPQKVVPYSSLIYDPQGNTWVYTSPQPASFVRHKVEVDQIKGDVVVLKDGPPAGTLVASQAVAELYGAEFKVGH
jgi:streptogramin lyase